QNGEVIRALVNTTDKGGVVVGANELVFNGAAGTVSVRTLDSSGQVLYYDMETCSATPCGTYSMKDLSGNANTGVFAGSGSTFPLGKYGKAVGFAGTGWIDAGNAPTVQLTAGSFTISAIIQTSSTSTDNEIVAKGGSCSVGG